MMKVLQFPNSCVCHCLCHILHIYPQILSLTRSPHCMASAVNSRLFYFSAASIPSCTSFTLFTNVILALQEFLSFVLHALIPIFSRFHSKDLLSFWLSHSLFNSQPLISPVLGAEVLFILLFTHMNSAAESCDRGTK